MFCKAPFVSQAKWADGRVSMCCNDSQTEHSSLDDEWNGELRKEARRAFMKGEIPERCKRCIETNPAKDGLRTHYDYQIKRDMKQLIASCNPDGSINVLPSYLHMSPSSKCQLACRMCSASVSTMYAKTFNEKPLSKVNPEAVLSYVTKCAPHLEYYVFHGGEPLMSPYFNEIMQELVKYNDNIHFCVLGNGMSLNSKGVDAVDWFKQFKSSEFMFSLDGTQGPNEYQRVHANHETIMKNIKRIHEEVPTMDIKLNHTLSNLTVMDLPNFYKMVNEELPFIKGLNHGQIHYPLEYKVHILPPKMRETILRQLYDMEPTQFIAPLQWSLVGVRERLKKTFESTPFDQEEFMNFMRLDGQKNLFLKEAPKLIDVMKVF